MPPKTGIRCGTGSQGRTVKCPTGKECSFIQKPESSRNCPYYSGCKWNVGNWSSCSSTCGDGSVRRQVICNNPGWCVKAIALGRGSLGKKPSERDNCTDVSK